MAKQFVCLLILVATVSKIESAPKKICPILEPLYFPNISSGLGTWYDGPYLPIDGFPESISCVKVTYDLSDVNNFWNYDIKANIDGHFIEKNGTVKVLEDGSMSYHGTTVNGENIEVTNYIRGFKPDEYASIFSCQETEEGIVESGYLIFRDKNPPKELVNEALDYLEREGLNTDLFVPVNQDENCSYEPNRVFKKIAEP